MADENSGQDRLNRLLAGANTGGPSIKGPASDEDSFDADDDSEIEGESDEDAALDGDEDDASDESEGTTEEVPDESDDSSEADEETDDEEPAEEVDAEEETVDEVAPAPAPTADPMLAAMQQQILFLQAQIQGQQQPPAADPSVTEYADLPDDLVARAMFAGIPPEEFRQLPQNVQAGISKVYADYSRKEARYAKNPALRYQEQFEARVKETVRTIVEPLLRAEAERETDRLIQKHLEPLAKTPEIRQRAVQIFGTLPGSNGDWGMKERVLEAAVKMARGEALERKADASKKANGAKKIQNKAAGGGKLKGAPTKKGNGKSGGVPDMKDNEKPEAYAKRIAKFFPTQ